MIKAMQGEKHKISTNKNEKEMMKKRKYILFTYTSGITMAIRIHGLPVENKSFTL
ncbi:MAG: hypothetical protein ABW007_09170 [Chitinophagaceae bacterium]